MNTVYYARHFDADGGMLRFSMFQCVDDGAAIQRVSAEPLPAGTASVEISNEQECIWRGEADGFWENAFAEERAMSPEQAVR